MTEQERRALFFKVTGMVYSSSHPEYRLFCKGMDAEREECAKLLETTDLSGLRHDLVMQNWTANLLTNYASAIRARGEK